MLSDNRGDRNSSMQTELRPALHDRIIWLCAAVGAIAAIAVLFLFGWSLWTAIAIAILIACPTVVALALRVQGGISRSGSKR